MCQLNSLRNIQACQSPMSSFAQSLKLIKMQRFRDDGDDKARHCILYTHVARIVSCRRKTVIFIIAFQHELQQRKSDDVS